jgi:hypothetical protein
MKGNIRKLAVFVMIAAIAMFMVVGIASAGNNNLVTGDYAVTAGMSCMATPFGFNDKLIANVPASVSNISITFQGIGTFKHDGTGSLETTGVQLSIPQVPGPPPFTPSGSAFQFSFTFTYNVADNDTITIDADKDSFQVTYDTGPITGATFTADIYSLSGMVSADHKTLTLGSPTTLIQTVTFQLPQGPVVFNMICNGSYVFTRLRQ